MLPSTRPVVSVCAVRTGCGKSQTTRHICELLQSWGKKVVVLRHPMPYGDLREQAVQRFSVYEDFSRHRCTIEEREEYEPLVEHGIVVYAGIDYGKILAAAEKEADIIVWDGGNNDTSFLLPDVHVVLFDPHRAGHERLYYPGETNLLLADVAIINKVDSADRLAVEKIRTTIQEFSPQATIIEAASPVRVDRPESIRGKRVLVVEDGPTLTHGGMSFGAGTIAARDHGAAEIVDPRPFAAGRIGETFRRYPHIGPVLPAMGYSPEQIADLEETIETADCDLVLFATPIHLPRLLRIRKPTLRVRYDYRDHGSPTLAEILAARLAGVLRR
jgi:predicted GTPase